MKNSIQKLMAHGALLAVVCTSAYTKEVCTQRDGSLDMTFGDHGKVVTDMGGRNDQANAIVVLPCGRIVAAGVAADRRDGISDFALAGYTPFGELDPSFGNNGRVITDVATVLSDAGIIVTVQPSIDVLSGAALQKDCNGCADLCPSACNLSCAYNCNIVVVGSSTAFSDDPSLSAVAVARYKCDGTLDTTFGLSASGITIVPVGISSAAGAVAIQEDNKIVVVGSAQLEQDGPFFFMIMRLNCDGTLDQTFGCDHSGIVLVSIEEGISSAATAVAIQQDGKIVVGGSTGLGAEGSIDFALVRLTKRGRLDVSFGPHCDGKVVTDFSGNDTASDDFLRALILTEGCGSCVDCASSLKIVAVGGTIVMQGLEVTQSFALAGYTENGCLDNAFGTGGLVRTVFNVNQSAAGNAAVLQKICGQKCKIIVGGFSLIQGVDVRFALARYTLGGMLDSSFGIGGKVQTAFDLGQEATILALALQENGDLVAAGRVAGNDGDFALARYKICVPCCAPICATGCGSDCNN